MAFLLPGSFLQTNPDFFIQFLLGKKVETAHKQEGPNLWQLVKVTKGYSQTLGSCPVADGKGSHCAPSNHVARTTDYFLENSELDHFIS